MSAEDEQAALWERWRKQRDPQARDQLLNAHLPLVQIILAKVRQAIPAEASRQLADDLKGAGVLGLVEAFDHFKEGYGASFATFASHRVRGAMLDELRRQDWLSKQCRHRWRSLQAAMRRVEQRLGRSASEEELAKEAGLNLASLRQEFLDLGPATLVFLDGLSEAGPADEALGRLKPLAPLPTGPEEAALRKKLLEKLAALIEQLPPNERLVVTLAAYEELSHKEIAAVLGVSAPRVSQVYARAVLRLQTGLHGTL